MRGARSRCGGGPGSAARCFSSASSSPRFHGHAVSRLTVASACSIAHCRRDSCYSLDWITAALGHCRHPGQRIYLPGARATFVEHGAHAHRLSVERRRSSARCSPPSCAICRNHPRDTSARRTTLRFPRLAFHFACRRLRLLAWLANQAIRLYRLPASSLFEHRAAAFSAQLSSDASPALIASLILVPLACWFLACGTATACPRHARRPGAVCWRAISFLSRSFRSTWRSPSPAGGHA